MGTPVPLNRLLAQHIVDAQQSLPDCRWDSPETITGGVVVPDIGLVMVTFTKFKSKRGKTLRWFWTPEKAELQD